MKILVTGANGQLGQEMRTLATNSAHDYIFTDVNQIDGLETTFLDITNLEQIRAIMQGVSVVVNCAAYTNVEAAEDNYDLAYKLNATAPGYLARCAKEVGATLFQVSTDYVFKGDGSLPYNETEPTSPIGAYGRTKLAGEKEVLNSGCSSLIFRTAWLYSPYGKNFVKTMRALTSTKPVVKVVFDQVGTPTYAADLALAIYSIIESGDYCGKEGVYHFSNEGVCSWYDFALEIAKFCGNNSCKVLPCHSDEFPTKVERPHFSVLDKTKYKNVFGKEVPHWRESLNKCINIIVENVN